MPKIVERSCGKAATLEPRHEDIQFSLRCYTNENRYLSYQVEGGVPNEAIHVKKFRAGCGQEEPGGIMRVTGSCHEQKSSNCPH